MILTDISLKRPVFATVVIFALVLLGMISYVSLNVEEWPNVEFPYVTVQINYKGASPEEVDSKIIQKVEEGISSVAGVKHIYSTAKEGVAITTVEFSLETSPNAATQDVRDKLGRIRADLPKGIDEPVIMSMNPSDQPIASIAVTSDIMDERELTTLVDDVIKKRLEAINGVGAITENGNQKREIHVNLNKDKIAAYGLSIPDIITNLQGENMDVPGGKLMRGGREVSLRTMSNLSSAEDFLRVPVGRKDGIQLYVENIGTVSDATEEITSITKFNGKPTIGLDVMKQSGTNTVIVIKGIKTAMESLKKELPAGVELTLVKDGSLKIQESIHDVLFNMVVGGLLAVIIVFIFLGNWRSTLISAVAIPASVISTFFAMKLFNFTLNSMSLMGLALVVGILIDDAIVVIENIVRHMEMGKDKFTAAKDATQEIGLAVTATTLTLVAVFVPVGLVNGMVGPFLKQFGITVAFAVLVSLFIAFTLTPILAANYLEIAHGHKKNFLGRMLESFNSYFDHATELYSDVLRKVLGHRLKMIALAALLFFSSLALTPLLGSSFLPAADEGEMEITVDIDAGLSVQGSAALADRMTDIIKSMPEVSKVYSTAKADGISFFVQTADKEMRKRNIDEISADMRRQFANIPGIRSSIIPSTGMRPEKPIQLVICGDSLDTLEEIAHQAQRIMENTKGAVDVTSTYKPGNPDVQMTVKREEAADLGVSTESIADALQTLYTGTVVSQFKDGNNRYDVRVQLEEKDRRQMEDLNGIYLSSRYTDSAGKPVMVPLSRVAETIYSTSPSEILRYDRQKEIQLSANLVGVSSGAFNDELFKQLEGITMPPGYRFVSDGESEDMNDMFVSMILAMVLAVSFIFFVLAAQFESYIDPFAIMLSLPLAMIGAIVGLVIMHSDLSLMSMIGIIMLMGLVTKNAILLVDFAKQRIAEGMPRTEALIAAACIRMRPIMMTTAAMIFGMLPMALGIGPGAEARAPMAHAIIGGLITSTMLTLVIVPVMYSLLDDMKQRFFKNRVTTIEQVNMVN